MKALTSQECAVMHNFNDYYKHITDSHITEGVTGISGGEELIAVNVGIATALTILKGKDEEIKDYFA